VHLHQALYLAVLLTLMLPAHLFAQGGVRICPEPYAWLIFPTAALLLVSLLWAIGGVGFSRMQPLLLTYMVVLILFHTALRPQAVLHRSWAWVGDIAQVEPAAPSGAMTLGKDAWISAQENSPYHATYFERSAADRLTAYTRGDKAQHRAGTSVQMVIRDTMPPLEDLVVGGHPGPIGSSSAVAVIIGGLFLMYRGLIDYRIPLWAVLFTFVGLMLLPVPLVINEAGPTWGPLILPYLRFDPRTLITFASYELMASPLLLMAFFLATSPSICPMTRRARIVYGVLLGVATAAAQLYLSVSFGPYVALLLVGLLSPILDTRYKPRPLV
jgi:Na+-translocating ferredoxin:NAD+ oxidoreductase RnfD subunit